MVDRDDVDFELREIDERILDELERARCTRRHLADLLGVSPDYIYQRIDLLQKLGVVDVIHDGFYQLASDETEPLQEETERVNIRAPSKLLTGVAVTTRVRTAASTHSSLRSSTSGNTERQVRKNWWLSSTRSSVTVETTNGCCRISRRASRSWKAHRVAVTSTAGSATTANTNLRSYQRSKLTGVVSLFSVRPGSYATACYRFWKNTTH